MGLGVRFLRMAAQQAGPVAIAEADPAAAERMGRTGVDLIVEPAVVRAIGPAALDIVGAVIAQSWRQLLRRLPINALEQRWPLGRRGDWRREGTQNHRKGCDYGERNCFHGTPS